MEQTLRAGTVQSAIKSLKIEKCKMGSRNPGKCGSHQLPSIWKVNSSSCFPAKLGDTKELEDFIADLDRTLASEYMPAIKKSDRKLTDTSDKVP